jgi:hypothetical protein
MSSVMFIAPGWPLCSRTMLGPYVTVIDCCTTIVVLWCIWRVLRCTESFVCMRRQATFTVSHHTPVKCTAEKTWRRCVLAAPTGRSAL